MLEWLTHLELLGQRLAGIVLILPGLLGVLLGIAVWLGGSLGRRGVVAVTAIMTGALLGFWVTGRSGVLVGGLGLGMAALVLPRLMTGIMTSFWIAIATIGYISASGDQGSRGAVSSGVLPDSMTVFQSVDQLLVHVGGLGPLLLHEAEGLSWMIYAVLTAVLVALTSIMALLPRLGMAIYSAVFGTVMITVGMGCLLLHKGSGPLLYVWNHYPLYCGIWAAMGLFGTTMQLFCCGRQRRMGFAPLAGGRKRSRRRDFAGNYD